MEDRADPTVVRN